MNLLSQWFSYPNDSLLLAGEYNASLVVLSIVIAVLASTLALALVDEARHRQGRHRSVVLLTGSVALGTGIWSMHFIGMLAFALCTTVNYLTSITLVSMLPGLFASVIALSLIARNQLTIPQLLIGGVLVGAGIGAMHYSGMAAMQMSVQLRYSPVMFALSIVVAVLLAILALWVRFGVSKLQLSLPSWGLNLIGGTVMGCAITGMHYTGMAAARFVAPADFIADNSQSGQSTLLALSIAFVTMVVGALVLTLNMLMKYRQLSAKKQAAVARLQATMQTSLDAIISIDHSGLIIDSNIAAERILGWDAVELKQYRLGELIAEPHRSEYAHYLQRYKETGRSQVAGVEREVRMLHKDGHLVPVRFVVGHVNLPDEKIIVAYITDLTQRIKMEQALRDSEAQFRSLIGNIPGAAYRCLMDEHWSMVFISPAVEELTGYPASDFMLPNPVRTYAGLIHADDQPMIAQTDFSKPFFLEYRIWHRDGSIRWALEHGNCVKDEQGNTLWLDGFIMDISTRKLMENSLHDARERAEQAAAARATFMANMSHEIRTPMNAILGFTDIVLGTALNSEQQKYLSTVSSSARALLHLLNDILDSAKLDKGKLELEITAFSLRQLLDSVVSTLWIQARQKALKLELDVAHDISEFVSGASDRIRQVLLNLIGNAIKFTQQGSVTVRVQRADNAVQFDIIDTGIGISAERLAQIFEPFTQADSSMSRRFGGTGLGTTISKQLVELMGGRIWASSEPGQGSCFSFLIPLADAEQADSQTARQISLKPLRILIADDIKQNIELLTILLTRAGHQVDAVSNGQQLLQQLQQQNYDVVILDSQMPVLDGLSAARQRRAFEKQHHLPAMPMVILTASVLQEDKVAAREAGIEGFASKPVDIDTLQLEIARVLKLDVNCAAGTARAVSAGGEPLAHTVASTLTHINLSKGCAMWGSQAAYVQEITHFIAQYRQWPATLTRALNQRQFTELQQQAHLMKGLSGHLAISTLYRLCSQLEQHSQQHAVDSCQQTIMIISQVITALCAEQLSLTTDASAPVTTRLSDDDILALLAILQRAAASNELDDDALNALQNCGLTAVSDQISQLIQAFNDFDFDVAAQQLTKLQQQLTTQRSEDGNHIQ